MATNDKFIQSIVELLDRLIDHQSRSSNLLTEIKLATGEVRTDLAETLRQLREKLPGFISDTNDESYKRLLILVNSLQGVSDQLLFQVKEFEKNKNSLGLLLEDNRKNIELNQEALAQISSVIVEKQEKTQELEQIVKEVHGFINSLKSKKAWIALIVACIVGAGTFLSALTGAAESIRKYFGYGTAPSISQPTVVTPPTKSNP